MCGILVRLDLGIDLGQALTVVSGGELPLVKNVLVDVDVSRRVRHARASFAPGRTALEILNSRLNSRLCIACLRLPEHPISLSTEPAIHTARIHPMNAPSRKADL
jgi:hypothetical protein